MLEKIQQGAKLAGHFLDLSEQSWFGSALIIGSAIASVIGISALFFGDPIILLAIGAGGGWTLCCALLVMNSWLRRRIRSLEAELTAERQRTDHFASTANNVSSSVLTVLRMTPEAPQPPPRLRPAVTQVAAPAELQAMQEVKK